MEMRILKKEEQEQYYPEMLEMLIAADDEFVPPLSARSSTVQVDLSSAKKANNGVLHYFEELKKQRMLVTTEQGKLIAFVSFKENFVNDKIDDKELPNIYISTLLVSPDGRGKGLTRKMYEVLFQEYDHANVFTRTWSTNGAHIKILSTFCFETMCVLKNDRGNGIDTVYFKKEKVTSI